MSFLGELRRELDRNGIRGRLARRIEAELADHLECDPQAQLGTPAEIAERFAVELRVVRTRRAAKGSFAALALSALTLFLASGAIQSAGGYPAHSGVLVSLTGLGMVAFAQVAFVAGVLALVRGLRGRTPGDLRLAQRRTVVAVAAGGGLACTVLAHALAVRPMPLWWHAAIVACALAPLPGLVLAGAAARNASALTPAGDAAGLSADLPGPLRRSPGWVLAALGAFAVAFVLVQGTTFEASVTEGLARAGFEAAGILVAVALLGRMLGLRR